MMPTIQSAARASSPDSMIVAIGRTLSLAKPVADMAIRQDVSGVCRVIFDFLSNLVDKDAQIFAFITILRPPNGGGRRL